MSDGQSTGQEQEAAFIAAHQDLVGFVGRCDDEQWATMVPVEGRTVAVMADHMAAGYALVTGWIEHAMAGTPIPGTRAGHDEENAQHARERAGVTREEVLARLEAAAPSVSAVLRAVPQELADTQVHFGPAGGPMPVARLMAAAALHVKNHLAHVREALFAAYQANLLELAGPGDPAAALEAAIADYRALIDAAGEDIATRPAEGEWSVLELIGHALDVELVISTRARWILAEDRPELVAFDQDDWVSGLDHASADPAFLLATWEALRRANVELWRRTPPARRGRVGLHRERGEESFETTIRLLAGHDRFHLAQARRTLEQVRGG